ncbi:MAG: D-aminoacyl-tRNA deacylase [Rikenellaceae bacterium]
MRLVIQRVSEAQMNIDGSLYSSIKQGLMTLIGIEDSDTDDDIEWLVNKMLKMRIFDDEAGVMNLDVSQIEGEILLVSQFTLYASTRKGNRPSYIRSAGEAISRPLYERFVERTRSLFAGKVATGIFGADMKISLINDGPVTIIIDSKQRE